MQLLLDTHTFLWWMAGSDSLSPSARKAIASERNAIFISAATAWEIFTKLRLGKLHVDTAHAQDLEAAIESQGFGRLPITIAHGQAAGNLPGPHKDPFDRMLIAQAMLEKMVLVSNEEAFGSYGVKRLW